MKKLVIAAGTGFLGNILINHFSKQFDEIVVLTRGTAKVKNNISYVNWDAKHIDSWIHALENAQVLINLTGKSVDCRYNEKNKAIILNSRVDSTNVLNEAIDLLKNPPLHFLNASTATIYEHAEVNFQDEISGTIGNDFSMNVAKAWEAAFYSKNNPKTLKTALRIGIVFGKSGGALPILANLTRLYFGGKQGKGNQFISFIHEQDFASAVDFIIQNKITGSINLVSPNPIQNQDFMQILRNQLKVFAGFPIPEFLLKIGAVLIRTEPELILKSRKVVAARLMQAGFKFKFPDAKSALNQIYPK
uniref:TIGR01777 family oxidoreductase n=1 Tax=Flavobacterium sp. TaxID=239 RepID=UPI00404941AA